MTFEEILDQALAMVQRRGRVTYRTLKLQFALDDEQLATLKDELLYSQPHVVDDAERGLLWTGARERPADRPPAVPSVTSASPPGQTTLGAFQPPHGLPLTPNAASSPCCFVTWWTPLDSPASSTLKSIGTWCVPISGCVPTWSSAMTGISPSTLAMVS